MSVWSELPDGCVGTWFDVPSGRLAGLVQGDPSSPRIVLVPGATGSKEDFILMLPTLAAAGFRVETFDLAGQYESWGAGPENLVPPRTRYDYELFVDDLVAVLEAGSTPVHLLGYSFAGVIASLVAIRRPELVASLTLLSSPPEPGQCFRGMKRVGWVTGLGSERLGATAMIWGIRSNVIRVPEDRLRFVKERFRLTRRSSVDNIIGLMRRTPDLRSSLAAIDVPKLVAVGEYDVWPLSLHAEFARDIDATLAVYRSGHSPCEESPQDLCRDLQALFRRAEEKPYRR